VAIRHKVQCAADAPKLCGNALAHPQAQQEQEQHPSPPSLSVPECAVTLHRPRQSGAAARRRRRGSGQSCAQRWALPALPLEKNREILTRHALLLYSQPAARTAATPPARVRGPAARAGGGGQRVPHANAVLAQEPTGVLAQACRCAPNVALRAHANAQQRLGGQCRLLARRCRPLTQAAVPVASSRRAPLEWP
jgi:hypothetical protein